MLTLLPGEDFRRVLIAEVCMDEDFALVVKWTISPILSSTVLLDGAVRSTPHSIFHTFRPLSI